MLSDDDYYFFDDYDYCSDNTTDDDWYNDEFDDYGLNFHESDHMDYEPYRSAERSDQQAIYKELNIVDPSGCAKNPLSLIDICASMIALNFPFAYIEDQTPPVPENLQLKVISCSFPQNMEKIKRYCSLNNGSSSEFEKAIRIVKCVKDLTQIGFHLSANVENRGYRETFYSSPPGKKSPHLYVNVKFDRGKITETHCPCESSSSWCSHVIAICLARIFLCDKCLIKPPLSDSLNNLTDYALLRTFTQYLIAEFSDRRILESAQNVLDRMLKRQDGETDAISETWGAPDPTAGPGLDEISQWLICEEGLKSRCTSLIHNADITEGCWGMNVAEFDASTSVFELWKSFQLEKSTVEGYFQDLSGISNSSAFSYNYHRRTYLRERSQEISKFLITCEELLEDDFEYSLKAVQTFTVQLLDMIEERNKRNYYRYHREKYESNVHLGCTPRPQKCWLFGDQLARIWRLLVLNPSISQKKRDEIFTTLEVLEAKLESNSSKQHALEWDALKHIQGLKSFSWDSLQLSEDSFKDDVNSDIFVSQCVVLETSKSSCQYSGDLQNKFSYPVSLTCRNFSSSVTVFCYLVEALHVFGRKQQSVRLAMDVALAVVRYYSTWLDGMLQVTVKNTLHFDIHEETKQGGDTGKKGKGGKKIQKKRQSRKRGRAGSKKVEEQNETATKCPNEKMFDQECGVIPICSIAYLTEILAEHEDLLADMLKLVKLRGLGINEEDLMECDDVTSDARSLIIRLRVICLALPKLQAPSLQIQVGWFNMEMYILRKLLLDLPSTSDLNFLRLMTSRMISLSDAGGCAPPYSLVLALFEHLFKPDSDCFDDNAEDGVSVALGTMAMASLSSASESIHRRMFMECCRRSWLKLTETVLCRVSVSRNHLKRALNCVTQASVMIGSSSDDVNMKLPKKATVPAKKKKFMENMIMEKVVASVYIAHALVNHANSLRSSASAAPKSVPIKHVLIDVMMQSKETPLNERQQLLYESAIMIVSRAFSVKNIACHLMHAESQTFDYSFMEFLQQNLKWMCSLSNNIDVKAFDIILERLGLQTGHVRSFNDDEVVRLCNLMLECEKKCEDYVWVRVKEALLTLLRPQSEKKISDILQLCRSVERESSSKRALLVPAICKELLLYIPGSSVEPCLKLDYLARAMLLMLTLSKKLETEDAPDDLRGLKELFSETNVGGSDHPGTSDEGNKHQPLDPNLQLCFDLAMETLRHIDDSERARNFDAKRRFENMCEVIAFVAKTASKSSHGQSAECVKKGNGKLEPFVEMYISRFIEALCNLVKDCLLLTDFFFELGSQLLDVAQHGSFGRNRVLLSDDCKLSLLCKSCSSLSVLLKRCISDLKATTLGGTMDVYLKETSSDTPGYIRTRAKNAGFYRGTSLVSLLEVLKRLMSISDDDDFEPFSYNLSSKHPVAKAAIDELNSRSSGSPGIREDVMVSENLISSLLLRRMFSPALACFDYDSDGWRY